MKVKSEGLPSRPASDADRGGSAAGRRRRPIPYVVKRILMALPTLLGIVTITFLASRVLTPDPSAVLIPETATPDEVAAMRSELGLDRPLWVQYFLYLGGIFRGDFGNSYVTREPVSHELLSRLPATLELGILALVIGVVIGVSLGVLAAVKRDRWQDHGLRAVMLSVLAVPQFWFGIFLITIFSINLGWLPGPTGRLPIGMDPPTHLTGFYLVDSLLTGNWTTLGAAFKQIILPAITLSLTIMGMIARVTRTAMLESLSSEYARNATALGFNRRRVIFKYCLRNSLSPIITMFGIGLSLTLGGAIIVETLFSWPGIGQYGLAAAQASNYPAIQAVVLYAGFLYVLIYLAVDLMIRWLDPRAKGTGQ